MNIIKRVLPALLAVMMVFSLTPLIPAMGGTAQAADSVTYIDENGATKTIDSYYTVDSLSDAEGISMYDGNSPGYVSYYVVNGNKTFENRLNAFGEVHLILKDGANLTLKKGLHVPPGSSLHIYAQSEGGNKGKIFAATTNVYSDHAAINAKYVAAIGGNDEQANGDIYINGGDITASGYNYGAGIGSGDEAGNAGHIVINGGKVNAYGGYDAAGIGGGNETNGGEIVINGGDVHAESGYYGAAIGGGDDAGGGHIVINDGKVYARNKGHDDGITTSKVAGAGIGGGRHGNAGKIEIKGGEVTGWSMQRGAGIGSGGDNNSDSQVYNSGSRGGEIYISGGTVTADSNYNRTSTMRLFEDGGAGIGSGAESFGVRIEITGGHTTAYGSCYDAEDPDLLHPTGIKPSAVIGNGYDTQSTGYVRIAGDENSKTYVNAASASQNAFGSEPGGRVCTVEIDYPRAIVVKDDSVLNADDRFTMIKNDPQHAYKIYLCDHGRTFYETDQEGHWMTCKQCGLEIEKQEHTFTYVQEEYGHSRWCEECGYVIAPVAHEFDPETGECVCGHKGVKVTIQPKNATHQGGDVVSWVDSGDKFKLPTPEAIGFGTPELSEFKYWRVNGSWQEFSPEDELTIQADTVIYPVYETSWTQFKEMVEGAEDGETVVLPGNCTAPRSETHIVIPQGKSLTLDLNGFELARGSCVVTVGEDGLSDGDVITVKGSLKVIDSSSDKTGRIRGGNNILIDGDSISDEAIGGGGVTVAGGSFLLESGTLSGNMSNKGGAVGVYGGGSFTMTGGKIEDNTTWKAGSAVYVEDGVFKAQGGEITDNRVFEAGGAVEFTSQGSIEVSGSPKIIGNHRADSDAGAFIPGNVYLADGQTITVAGSLDSEAQIGVSAADILGTPITDGLSDYGSALNFISDNEAVAFDVIDGEIKAAPVAEGYKINAEIKGNGSIVYGARRAAAGDRVSLRAVPDEGYRFSKWEVEGTGASLSDANAADTILTMGSDPTTVKVYFVKDTIPTDISLNVGGTPLAENSQIDLEMGDELTLSASVLPETAAEAPVVWSDDEGGRVATVSENGVVTAKQPGLTKVTAVAGDPTVGDTVSASVWISVAAKNTVTFDTNEGEGFNGQRYVSDGGTVARPEDPTREGYKFDGWRKVEEDDSLAEEDYDFASPVTESFTLKAAWEHTKHDKESLEHIAYKDSTCTEDGNAEYWHCSICGKNYIFNDEDEPEEVTEDYIVFPAGHVFENWKPYNGEKHQRVCRRDPSHVEYEDHVWDKGEVTKQPSDEEDGEMTYTCEVCGEQKTEKISAKDATVYNVDTYLTGIDGSGSVLTEPSKGVSGTKIHLTAFPEAGFRFGGWTINGTTFNDAMSLSVVVAIEESDIEAEALFILPIEGEELVLKKPAVHHTGEVLKPEVKTVAGHVLKEGEDYTMTIKDENDVEVESPSEPGTYTVTVTGKDTCTGTSAPATFKIIADHEDKSWSEPEYTWSEDCSTVTASHTCTVCGAVETETVETTTTVTDATCTEDGEAIYTSDDFTTEGFEVQTKTEPIEKSGHDWGEPTYEWSDDNTKVTATRVCGNNDQHQESETVDAVSEVTKQATCTENGEIQYTSEYFDNRGFFRQKKTEDIAATGHDWSEWTVTKQPTETAAGSETRECSVCHKTETRVVPAKGYAPGADPNQKGVDGTALGEGASAAAADRAITSLKSDADPRGTVFSKLKLKSTKQKKTSITLTWTKVSKAKKYVIYGNKCGKANKYKKLATVSGKTKAFSKVAGKKLKKGTYYKFMIVALDKDNNVVTTSKVIHAATKGGKVGNHKSVTVKKSVLKKARKLKKGKSLSLKAKAVAQSKKLKVKKHVKLRFESTNKKIATVSSKGVIKGKKKGSCYVYAYAQNGVCKKIKVTVK